MKRFFSISLFILLSVNIISATINPRTLTQGIYNARASNLLIGTPITARIASPNDNALILIIDSDLNIRELVKLGPQSTEHVLEPLDYDSSIIIFGSGSVTFS